MTKKAMTEDENKILSPVNNRKKTATRSTGRPFKSGQSGNPKGRPRGARSKVSSRVVETLEASIDKVLPAIIEKAVEGNPAALKIIFDRISPAPRTPPREPYELGALDDITACAGEVKRLASAVAAGDVDEDHAAAIRATIESAAKMFEHVDLEARLAAIEEHLANSGGRR
jgi:hypothetical protein